MKIKCKCTNCKNVTYLTGLNNNRSKVTKFKKLLNKLNPCIYCDKDDCIGLNEALQKIGSSARFQSK